MAATILLAAVTVALTLYVPVLVGQAIDCIVTKGDVDFEKIAVITLKIGIFCDDHRCSAVDNEYYQQQDNL